MTAVPSISVDDSSVQPCPDQAKPAQQLVAILLATYNGARFLPEQLASFERQEYGHWRLWASDDGSTDATLQILSEYGTRWEPGSLNVLQGPGQGSSRNFLSLVHNADIQADYYAYSDQDDIWEDAKLRTAVGWLSRQAPDTPALYCSRTRLVDESGEELGISPLFKRPPAFANALMQNITGGNTMVFNDAARRLMMTVPPEVPLVIHDWWTYIVVTAAGGQVNFDPCPGVRYRQHGGNLIGMSVKGPSLGERVRKLFEPGYRHNGDLNVQALGLLRSSMSPEAARVFDLYAAARQRGLLPRLWGIRRSGVYRMTRMGDFGLLAATLLNNL